MAMSNKERQKEFRERRDELIQTLKRQVETLREHNAELRRKLEGDLKQLRNERLEQQVEILEEEVEQLRNDLKTAQGSEQDYSALLEDISAIVHEMVFVGKKTLTTSAIGEFLHLATILTRVVVYHTGQPLPKPKKSADKVQSWLSSRNPDLRYVTAPGIRSPLRKDEAGPAAQEQSHPNIVGLEPGMLANMNRRADIRIKLDECAKRIHEHGLSDDAIAAELLAARAMIRDNFQDGEHDGMWRSFLAKAKMSEEQARKLMRPLRKKK